MSYYVYILKCKNGSLYTGYTNNINRRLDEHNRGTASKYTRCRLPVTLSYLEKIDDRSIAMKRETIIKRLPRLKKIELCNSYSKEKK